MARVLAQVHNLTVRGSEVLVSADMLRGTGANSRQNLDFSSFVGERSVMIRLEDALSVRIL